MIKYPAFRNYDLDPVTQIHGHDGAVQVGYEAMRDTLRSCIRSGTRAIAFELYPGVDEAPILEALKALPELTVLRTLPAKLPGPHLTQHFYDYLTDDRVFGYMCPAELEECFDPAKLADLRKTVREARDNGKPLLVLGVGALLALPDPDLLWHFDLTRWEIQLRFRRGAGTWLAEDPNSPTLAKYKIGYFIEWRMADRIKQRYAHLVDYRVDANDPHEPRFIHREAYEAALNQTAARPFRMQAYYDPSVWGGQWMKHVFGLDPSVENYGWSFDGVPEENCLKWGFGEETLRFPAINLVHARPRALLGEHVFGRFGAEFPIRFDFLDTMEGGNLSLQVHPLTGYIREKFGMDYTQDESYYILDATPESTVYLGVRDDFDLEAFRAALERAQAGEEPLDAERFVNRFPVQKHDHVLIPAGTIHCSGKNTLVLEISATPYIFTFKLWDWGRIGLDGLPRPIHVDHGIANIQTQRNPEFCRRELLHRTRLLSEDADAAVEHTGLHELEFIETERYRIRAHKKKTVDTHDSVNVLNLVDGEKAWFESVDGSFDPVEIHYAETFVVPAGIGSYVLRAESPVMFILARVRED